MRETLGLDDPLDRIDLRRDIERAFDVSFGEFEAEACHTAGDVFGALCRHMNAARPGGCATAMAFYRLRRALGRCKSDAVWAPGSDLGGACGSTRVDLLLTRLERNSALRMPRPAPGRLTRLGAWLIISAVPVAPVWWALMAHTGSVPEAWSLPMALLACGLALVRRAPCRLPDGCETLGGLARRTAALNFGFLHAAGAAARHRDLWAALAEVLAEYACSRADEIGPETRIVGKVTHAA